ncbi:MAG: acyl-CoA thioesterase [bacterium]|nr:acyl-CoA thioesterase [bacterium]
MYQYETTIKMHHIDAAGVLFFAHQLTLVHDAYEAFLESGGMGLAKLLKKDYVLPIIHAETDYKAPLRVGDRVTIRLTVQKEGQSSFVLAHEIVKESGQLAGSGHTVHVAVNKQTQEKIPLPGELKECLRRPRHAG